MVKRFLACLLALMLMCPAVMAHGEGGVPHPGGMLKVGTDGYDTSTVPGNPSLSRREIMTIDILSDLSGAPQDAWDMSALGNRSVLAWATPVEGQRNRYALTIAADGPVKAHPNSAYLFAKYSGLRRISFHGAFDTSSVTDMSYMFFGSFDQEMYVMLDLSSFDTSAVRTMESMFMSSDLMAVNVSSFDTSSVTDMSYMFAFCDYMPALDLTAWNMDAVKTMNGMFYEATGLKTLHISPVGSAVSQYAIFDECPAQVFYPDGTIITQATATPKPVATAVPTLLPTATPTLLPTATPATASSGVQFTSASTYLPDPHYFFREKLYHGEKDISGGVEIHFVFAYSDRGAAAEYIDQLKDSRFNLKLRTTDTLNLSGVTYTLYVFDYTGTADVDEVTYNLADSGKSGTTYRAPVMALIRQYKENPFGWCHLQIYCPFDFTFVDSGDRSSIKSFVETNKPDDPFLGPVGTGSGSMGGSTTVATTHDSSSPYGLQCTACKGTGKCSTCDGRGYLYSSASGKYDRNCYKCNTTGRCSTCGGTGKR